jgi:outer membrane protein assembly factor BamB
MKKPKLIKTRIVMAFLALLLVSSSTTLLVSTQTPVVKAADSSNSLLQYDWPSGAYNDARTEFYGGPAPNSPDVRYTLTLPIPPGVTGFQRFNYQASGAVTSFNGKSFVLTARTVNAFDPFTGSLIWSSNLTQGPRGFVYMGAWKLDDTYLCVDTGPSSMSGGPTIGGLDCFRIDNGAKVWNITMGIPGHAGAELKNYWPMSQSVELKMKYVLEYNTTTLLNTVVGWDLSPTPNQPIKKWTYVVDEPCEILCFGGGSLYVGTYTYHIFALNGTTGALEWTARKEGLAAYSAIYADGRLFHGDGSTRMTCYNATTGEILWDDIMAGREFFSYGEAYAYGRIFAKNIGVPTGFIGCWDGATGALLWKNEPAYYQLGYLTPCVGDGKLYTIRSDGTSFAGRTPLSAHFACYDCFTGDILWTVPYQFTSPTLGYGNLYGVSGGTIYCFADVQAPWSYYRGNVSAPGIGQSGPTNITVPRWKFPTGDAVQSSAAVVEGKVYFGSNDKNIYCLDAYTGTKIWNYTTEYKQRSSPAVYDGKVYVGPDDGYVYCFSANDGSVIWKHNIYAGNVPPILIEVSSFQPRSSPLIMNNRLYVGALDGKVYCLDIGDGSTRWTYTTGNPICGSPAYSNGTIFIASTDRNMYAFDATSGTKLWNWTTPKNTGQLHFAPTPVVAEGKVFFGGGAAYATPIIFVALYANNGSLSWQANFDRSSNTQPIQCPTYFNGTLYISDHMGVSAYNPSNGSRIWFQWLGFQVFGSVALANDLEGNLTTGAAIGPKIYIGSDSYSITCLRAAPNGTVLSSYTTEAQIASSPAIWNRKLYVGSADGTMYCFDDAPNVSTDLWAESDKSSEMWANETMTIYGKLNPGIAYSNITVSFTKPNNDALTINATTDEMGNFQLPFNPTELGTWSWVAYYLGQIKPAITYGASFSSWYNVTVIAAPVAATPTPEVTPTSTPEPTPMPTSTPEPTPTPTPTPETVFGMSPAIAYAIVAIIIILVVAVGAYAYMRRKKSEKKET